jgi:sirohydrochlorin cobaltochelatase
MPAGLRRCLLLQPDRIIVLPYLLFTGVLVKRIAAMARDFGQARPEVEVLLTDDIGELPIFLNLLFERERETLEGTVSMNCDACKWRRAGLAQEPSHGHSHDDQHASDPYENLQAYHERIWKP